MTDQVQDKNTVGLSEKAHSKLQQLKEDNYFSDMVEGYRFAIALALAHGHISDTSSGSRKTMFNVGTFDPDRSIYNAVASLRKETDEAVYKTAERLAEWGVEELYRLSEQGKIPFSELLEDAEKLAMATNE